MTNSRPKNTYVGINNETNCGMTRIAKIIRDAWVFGILPEDETCEGWTPGAIEDITVKVNDEWDKYGCLVSNLPPELRERHEKIHREALEKAKQAGWDGETEIEDDT